MTTTQEMSPAAELLRGTKVRPTGEGTVLNDGLPLHMTSIYHQEFAAGDPYNIPPSAWTSQIEFRDYRWDESAGKIYRSGRPAGADQSAGDNELAVKFVHTYHLHGLPRLVWYSHIIARYGVYRYGFLVLDQRNRILDAMEWDFLGQDPGDDLSSFEQVSEFLQHTVKIIPHARLLFHIRPGQF